jgi:hypothetical protein
MSGSLLVEIGRRMRRGDSIDDVDLELIERADLSADEKATLWLTRGRSCRAESSAPRAEVHLRLVSPRA